MAQSDVTTKDKKAMTNKLIDHVLGLTSNNKVKAVKVKIKFDNPKVGAIKKRAASMPQKLSDSAGVTR